MNASTRRASSRSPHLKKLAEQTVVITGATSGIGLATARQAARAGARLVLSARNEQALQQLEDELRARGARVATVVADVGEMDEVRRIEQAAQQFGGFDTWINNAAVSMYGSLLDVPLEDEHQLFETNYWGMVHGSRVAAKHLRNRGGAIINVASSNAETSAPLQGTYSAAEHAIKGYTNSLRMELEAEDAPVAVTLVKPGPVDTPFTQHARNHLEGKSPRLTPPVYSPSVVAETILFCAENPRRSVTVGGGSKLFAMASKIAPKLTDKLMGRAGTRMQMQEASHPGKARPDSLYEPSADLKERGDYPGTVRESSVYTRAALHPKRTGALVVASGVVAGMLWRAHRKRNGTARGHRLIDEGSHAARRVAKASHTMERRLERKTRKAARKLPHLARTIEHAVERNLPRR